MSVIVMHTNMYVRLCLTTLLALALPLCPLPYSTSDDTCNMSGVVYGAQVRMQNVDNAKNVKYTLARYL